MPNLIIHAGTGKTGTTSIQTSLARNEAGLAALGFRVLKSNRSAPQRSAKHRLAWKSTTDQSWDLLAKEVEQIRGTNDTFIFSNESLFSTPDSVLERLAEIFSDFRVASLLYVREQSDYVQSLILQNQKKHERAIDLHDPNVIDKVVERRLNAVDYLDVARRFERYFGDGSFHARIFDRAAFHNGSLIEDFYSTIGVPTTAGFDLDIESNPGLTVRYADVLRERWDELTENHRDRAVQDLALRLSKNEGGDKYFLPIERVEEIQAQFAESNRTFFSQFVGNGGAFPEKATHRTEPPTDIDAVTDHLTELLELWPWLPDRGWNKKVGMARRLFADGWSYSKHESGVSVRAKGSSSTIRFRRTFRTRPSDTLDNGLILDFDVEQVASRMVRVGSGEPTLVEFGNTPIAIPPSAFGDLDEVEITILHADAPTDLIITGMRTLDEDR